MDNTTTYTFSPKHIITQPQYNDKIQQEVKSEEVKMLEIRIAKIEIHLDYLKQNVDKIKTDIEDIKKSNQTDFRILFGALITVTIGLAGLMAKGFGWY